MMRASAWKTLVVGVIKEEEGRRKEEWKEEGRVRGKQSRTRVMSN
jgi:hypothetical protein